MAIFDFKAESYDDWYNTAIGKFADDVETSCAVSMLGNVTSGSILDVGCGTGNFSIKLAQMGFDVTGIDLSEKMLDKAKKKTKNLRLNIKFIKGDTHSLSFEDNAFDAVVSMAAFEFIEDASRVLHEMFRVAKPGAPVIVGTINRDSDWGAFYLEKAAKGHVIFKHALFKGPDELKKLFPQYLTDFRQCLFVPPDARQEDISLGCEQSLSQAKKGGFMCAKWIKSNNYEVQGKVGE